MNNKILLILMVLLALTNLIFAQANTDVEMADAMVSNGKIYVVICVIAIVFACIIYYLISLDRKISKLEKSK